MSDLSATVQSAFHHQQVEFVTVELSVCSRSANLASKMYRAGDMIAAERTTADAEKCYAMVLPLPIRSERFREPDNQIYSGIQGENGSPSHDARRATTIEEVKNSI